MLEILLIAAVVVAVGAYVMQDLAPLQAHPCPGARITSPFGERIDPINGKRAGHGGVDFGVAVGTELRAVGSGVVREALQNAGGDGTFLRVTLDDGRDFSFSHLSRLLVGRGDRVEAGQVIALSGNSGRSTGPHLHFEVRTRAGVRIDPLLVLPS